MSKHTVSLFLWTAFAAFSVTSIALQQPQVQTRQVQFLEAESAEVLPREDGGVSIVVEGLGGEIGYGVIVKPDGESNWIEATRNGEWPPVIVPPTNEAGEYLLRGKPGDTFDLRIDRHPDYPLYERVVIEGSDPPLPPPTDPGDYEAIKQLSAEKAAALNDRTTAGNLAKAIVDAVGNIQPNESYTDATRRVVLAIEDVLRKRQGKSIDVDWYNGWRVHMQAALDALGSDVDKYKAGQLASAAGLEMAAKDGQLASTKTTVEYTRKLVRRCEGGQCWYEYVWEPVY